MAKRKLKDIKTPQSRFKTVGQDPLKRPLQGTPLSQSHPPLACEYVDKGPYSIDDLSAGSNREVEWRHDRCGEIITVAISIRTRAWDEGTFDQGCYICSGKSRGKTKPQVIPEWLMDQCIPDSRLAPIKDLSPWSQPYRLFNCPRGSGLIFSSRIVDRLNPVTGDERQGCPCEVCCLGTRINLKDESSDPEKPNLWKMFVRTGENVGFDRKNLPLFFRVRWRCEADPSHLFSRSLAEFYEEGCPKCTKALAEKGSILSDDYKHIVREFWFVPSQPSLALVELKPGSNVVAAFRCPVGHTYCKAIYRRTLDGENCPFCAGKRSDAPSLFSVAPYLLKLWDQEKNMVPEGEGGQTRQIEPDRLLADDRKKYWFLCYSGHSYKISPKDLLELSDQCPDCAILPNCVGNASPELAKQWDEKKNGARTPWNTPAGTSYKVWWQCEAGPDHEWSAEVYKRCKSGTGCPFCANKRLSITNSLQTVFPETALLMHPTANGGRQATEVVAYTKEQIWWLCSCSKPYRRVIQHMVGQGPGCVDCRKAEKAAHSAGRKISKR